MTPEEFFYVIFSLLPRQGPGCTGATQKAWSYLPALPKNAQVLDVGCGTGAQTRDLAALTQGTITAVDNYQPFLDTVTARVQKNDKGERITTVNASMDALPFEKEQFDLIWSEGASTSRALRKDFMHGNLSAGKADISWSRMLRGLRRTLLKSLRSSGRRRDIFLIPKTRRRSK
jgi:SAM-dependent methyltransferase